MIKVGDRVIVRDTYRDDFWGSGMEECVGKTYVVYKVLGVADGDNEVRFTLSGCYSETGRYWVWREKDVVLMNEEAEFEIEDEQAYVSSWLDFIS